MNNATQVALAKIVAEKAYKEAREKLEPGQYAIDTTVRVTGLIKVGEDYTQRLVAKADPWALLAVALSRLKDTSIAQLVELAEAEIVDYAPVKLAADAAILSIKESTTQTCKGKVTTVLDVVEVKAAKSGRKAS